MPFRISWIDICRGIGIILVIYGHALSSESIRHLIYAFHMPLFFFISGLVFKYQRDGILRVIKKSTKTILIPYFMFAFLSYAVWLFNNDLSFLTPLGVLMHLEGIIYGNSSNLFFNTVLWFLPCLFITKVCFAILTKFLKTKHFIAASLILLSIGGYTISIIYSDLKLPFGLETSLTAIVFFGFASLLSKDILNKNISSLSLLSFLVLACVAVAQINFYIYGHQIDMRLNNLGNYFLFYVGALTGIMATIILSMKIRENFVLEYLGKYSLVLFALHPITFFYLSKVLEVFINPNTVSILRSTYLSPVYTVLSIVVILLITKTTEKVKYSLSNIL